MPVVPHAEDVPGFPKKPPHHVGRAKGEIISPDSEFVMFMQKYIVQLELRFTDSLRHDPGTSASAKRFGFDPKLEKSRKHSDVARGADPAVAKLQPVEAVMVIGPPGSLMVAVAAGAAARVYVYRPLASVVFGSFTVTAMFCTPEVGAQLGAAVLPQAGVALAVYVMQTFGALAPLYEDRLYETMVVLVGVELPFRQSCRTRLYCDPLGTST
jgi:hypothetical protein